MGAYEAFRKATCRWFPERSLRDAAVGALSAKRSDVMFSLLVPTAIGTLALVSSCFADGAAGISQQNVELDRAHDRTFTSTSLIQNKPIPTDVLAPATESVLRVPLKAFSAIANWLEQSRIRERISRFSAAHLSHGLSMITARSSWVVAVRSGGLGRSTQRTTSLEIAQQQQPVNEHIELCENVLKLVWDSEAKLHIPVCDGTAPIDD